MNVRHAPSTRIVTALLVVLMILGIFKVDLVSARDRYEPPTGVETVTPLSMPETGSGSGEGASNGVSPVIAAPAVEEGALPQANVRERPDSREFEITSVPTATPTPTPVAKRGVPRLNEPVLRWLPEIMKASDATGVPAKLIAGVMRLESNGNPNIISPAGARGLMQIMPEGLIGQGIPESRWHDPATNIRAGAVGLKQRAEAQGSWEGAVAAYFGFGCDVFGTCTDVYIEVAFGWADFYADAIADPYSSEYSVLGDDWTPPQINPFVEKAPSPVATPPTTTPTPVTTRTPAPTRTPTPGGNGSTPTAEPTFEPTTVATEMPTEVVTEVPTESPTEVPTEAPTEAPTAPPLEPGGEGTPPA